MGRRAIRALWAVPLGLVTCGAAVFFIGIAAGDWFHIPKMEGGYDMQVAFLWTPLAALAGALIGLIWALWRG